MPAGNDLGYVNRGDKACPVSGTVPWLGPWTVQQRQGASSCVPHSLLPAWDVM